MDKKTKKLKKKEVEKFFKDKSLDFMNSKIMKTLGIESVDDTFVLTDEDLNGSLNPVQLRKFLNAVRQHPEFGTTASKDDGAPPPIDRSSTRRPGGNTAATGPAQQARAMYEWKATADEHLDVAEGEVVTVINDAKKWWNVRNAQGKEGTVPSNYMEKIGDAEPVGFEDDGGSVPPPLFSREAKPMPPDEQEECIYEPVAVKAPPDPAAGIVIEDEDWAGHVYEDPDDPDISPKRPNVVRSASITNVPESAPPLSQTPKDWMNSDVLRWLKSEDLKDFQDVFYANGFDGATLVTLHSSSFKAGGFDAERCDVLQLSLDKLSDMGASKGRATALYDYDATKSTQLSFREGDILQVLDDTSAWWKCKNTQGQKGVVPSNYLEMLPAGACPPLPSGAATEVSEVDPADAPWYTDLDRRAAESLLKSSGVEGAFLIRPSQTTVGDHTLTALGPSGIMNLKIQEQAPGVYVLGQFSSQFSSIFKLVDHHKKQEIRITGKAPVLLTKAMSNK